MKIKTVLLILALAVTSAMAQGGGRGRGPGYSYDPSTETKITGSIEQIKTTDTMCHTGTHLMVKTDTAETEVGLGPAHFLTGINARELVDQSLDWSEYRIEKCTLATEHARHEEAERLRHQEYQYEKEKDL